MSKRNVLLIITDEHRADCAGFAGNTQVQTPHLDALAGDGVVYEQAFCCFPVCTPSRYSIVSGMYVHQHGGRTNHCTPSPAAPMFPTLLKNAGWRTSAVGKMHYTPTYLDVGFEHMMLAEQAGDGRLDDDYHRELLEQGLIDALDIMDQRGEVRKQAPDWYWQTCGACATNLPDGWDSTDWIGRKAREDMAQWRTDGGNLTCVSFIKPHHPFDPPQRWLDRYDPAAMDPLPGWTDDVPAGDAAFQKAYFDTTDLDRAKLQHVMAHYYATISHIDEQVGLLVDDLKQRGIYDDTLIIFTSDHGEHMGFHHMLLKGGPMYDATLRVPLVIKYPREQSTGERQGQRVTGQVSLIDLAPTVLEAAGIEVPGEMAGQSLADGAERDAVFAEAWSGAVCARTEKWKLIVNADGTDAHLFDLASDPLEFRNLADDPATADVRRELRTAILRWRLGDARTPVYCNEVKPMIAANNALTPDPARRRAALDQMHGLVKPHLGSSA